MYFRKKTSSGRAYLQIVESRRQGAQVRQQVIATLGRVEELRESGQLERLLRSGARFAAKAIVVDAVADGAVTASAARRIGPALVFERLWEETGCRRVVEDLAGSRKHGFPLERAVFLTVLHRLFSGGSASVADDSRLLEEVASEANLAKALLNVVRNKGAPGLDECDVFDRKVGFEFNFYLTDISSFEKK